MSQYQGLGEGHRGLDHQYGENLYWGGSTQAGQQGAKPAISAW